MKKILGVTAISLISILLLSFAAFAESPEKLNVWFGNVSIGTNTSTDGALIGAYENGVLDKTFVTGSNINNAYLIGTECDAGNTMFLKVWGINATWQTCANYLVNSTNLSVSLVASGGTCYYTSACASNYRCCSGATDINDGTTAGSCTSACSSGVVDTGGTGGGSGGSSGGGGGLSSQTTSAQNLAAGATGTFNITKTDLLVNQLDLQVINAVASMKITVMASIKPSAAPLPISAAKGKVIKYLSIISTSTSSNIKSAKIKFSVPVSYYAANELDYTTTKLLRWNNGAWETLDIKFVSTDGISYVFEATFTGLSVFAIVADLSDSAGALELLDLIRDFYAGESSYTAFQLLDRIRAFYGGQ